MRTQTIAATLLLGIAGALLSPADAAHAQAAAKYTVAVEPDYIEVEPGAEIPFKAILLRKGERKYSSSDWEWYAKDGGRFKRGQKTKIAQNVFIAPNKPGTYHIEVTTDRAARLGQKATVEIVVKAKEPELHCARVAIEPSAHSVYAGESVTFVAKAWDQKGDDYRGASWEWGGDGGSWSANVYTAGDAPGKYQIWVKDTVSGQSAKAWVTVQARASLHAIALAPQNPEVKCGQSIQFQAAGFDQWKKPYANVKWEWGSDAGGTITAGGLYTAGDKPGRYKVTLFDTSSNKATFTWVTVKPAGAAYVKIGPRVARCPTNGRVQLSIEFFDEQCEPLASSEVTWSIEGGAIDANGWWTPKGCYAGKTYKVWVVDDHTGARDEMFIYVYKR